MIVVISKLDIRQVRHSFTDFIEDGTLDKRILDTLILDDNFIPKECELWDYKRESGKGTIFLAETVLTIVSFYNTYGGYLIYGIDEITDDSQFTPYGIKRGDLDLRQLRQVIANYVGEPIDISYNELDYDIAGSNLLYGILHIPRRPSVKCPVFFGKHGPAKQNGRSVFQKDQTYIRVLDQCLPATKKEHYQLLFSDRNNDYLWDPDSSFTERKSRNIIVDHNLPNRNFICPKFLGREAELQELWKWLGDELSNTKVLAGDGGKGKTSIAYEFAEEVCYAKPYNIEKVIWLTAKTKQFSAELNKYVDVLQTDFYDLETLLKAICLELPILEEEITGASIPMLKKYVKKALENILCLIIVDNIDSIDEEQQRQIFETAMQFPGSRARFLLTTRINKLYSGDQCIAISGFNKEDYHGYVAEVLSRFKCSLISQTQTNNLRDVSDGSPLFTESILRLHRDGINFKQALRNWEGKEGNEVRKAALLYEIEQLSIEAKRILLATSYMKEASITELRQVTGYNVSNIQQYINELNAFFLLETKPFIKKESRFTISENTGRLVSEFAEQLVASPGKLRTTIIKHRQRQYTDKQNRTDINLVNAAINQARAMSRENNFTDATETIKNALVIRKNHPDLLLELGRCQFDSYRESHEHKLLNDSRMNFKKSYDNGKRGEILFSFWFEADNIAKDYVNAIDISSLALQQTTINRVEWLKRRSTAYSQLSRKMHGTLNPDLAIDNMKKAARDIGTAIRIASDIHKLPLVEIQSKYDDELWSLFVKKSVSALPDYVEAFDLAQFFIQIGDKRYINYERLANSLISGAELLTKQRRVTHGQISLVQNLQHQTKVLISREKDHLDGSSQEQAERIVNSLDQIIDDLLHKFRK